MPPGRIYTAHHMAQVSNHPHTNHGEEILCVDDGPSQPTDAPHSSPEEILSWRFEDETPESYLSWTPPQASRRCPGATRGVRGSRSVRSGLRVRGDFSWPFKVSRRPTC
jgi:hypothetical protein